MDLSDLYREIEQSHFVPFTNLLDPDHIVPNVSLHESGKLVFHDDFGVLGISSEILFDVLKAVVLLFFSLEFRCQIVDLALLNL